MPTTNSPVAGIFHLDQAGLIPVDRAAFGDELLFLAIVPAHPRRIGSPLSSSLEIYRGVTLRQRQTVAIDLARNSPLAFRIHWTDRNASSRLTVVLRIDGREWFRQTVLLLPQRADAQGRVNTAPLHPPSDATAVEVLRRLDQLLGNSGHRTGNPASPSRNSD